MTARITGQQARHLLEGATPGPWAVEHDANAHPEDCEWSVESVAPQLDDPIGVVDFDGVVQGENDANLIAAAPALAETVAWLYGREANGGHSGQWHQSRLKWRGAWAVMRIGGAVDVTVNSPASLDPDEAADLARALLAAAEEARDE